MFEQIFQLIKDHAAEALSGHPEMAAGSSVSKEDVAHEAAGSILETIQNKIGEGNFSDMTSLLSGEHSAAQSPIAAEAVKNLTGRLGSNLSMEAGKAAALADSVIPSVLSKLVEKTNDPEGQQFDLKGMISSFAGGNFGGIDLKSILGSFGGKPRS